MSERDAPMSLTAKGQPGMLARPTSIPPRTGGPISPPRTPTQPAPIQPPQPPLFGPFVSSRLVFQAAMSDEIERLAPSAGVSARRRLDLERDAKELRVCGTQFAGRRCSCGFIQGTLKCTCRTIACPACSRQRAEEFARRSMSLHTVLHKAVPRMRLSLASFFLKHDPANESDLSIDGLRLRRVLLEETISAVWKKLLRPNAQEVHRPGLALVLEVTQNGQIRADGLFWGPQLDPPTFGADIRKLCGEDSDLRHCEASIGH